MERYLKTMIGVFVCVTLAMLGTFAGYKLTASPAKDQDPTHQVDAAEPLDEYDSQVAFAPEEAVINAHTSMVYEYIFPEDGLIETSEEMAPYFLLNMNEERLRSVFTDWDIISFSSEEVVMRKELTGRSAQHYIVGVMDNYVSVFYQQPVNGTTLKEVTSTLVSSLSPEEQLRLTQGVPVSGEEELIRILEDYTS